MLRYVLIIAIPYQVFYSLAELIRLCDQPSYIAFLPVIVARVLRCWSRLVRAVQFLSDGVENFWLTLLL